MLVKQIGFVLENCEYVVIDTNHIEWLIIENLVTRKVLRDKEFIANLIAKNIIVGISNKASEVDINRIWSGDDITSIVVVYEDGSEITYYVAWEDGLHDTNKLQRSKFLGNGTLQLVIGAEVSEQFDKEEKEDADAD